jgi:transcriptional regulator NrdR family protein
MSQKVPCPYCQHPKSRVASSPSIVRVRKCLACGRTFKTREVLIPTKRSA